MLTELCVAAGEAAGDGAGVVCVTAGELELFGCVMQAIPIVDVAMRLKSKMRGSKLIVRVLSFVINLWGDD
jgi:hypothetical protein